MATVTDAPNRIPWPPIIYGAAVAIALAAQFLWLLPWASGVARVVLAAIGLCLICAGVALEIVTVLTFRRHHTTILPHRAAVALITDGPFAKSRNPIYLGNTMLVIGAGLLFGVAWLVIAGLAAAALVQKLAIVREERHLTSRFGKAWDDYAVRTPRWLLFR